MGPGIDTVLVDNGQILTTSLNGTDKVVSLITDYIPYYGGMWLTNYTLNFDVTHLSSGASAAIYVDGFTGIAPQYYTTGSHVYGFNASPYLSGYLTFNPWTCLLYTSRCV